MGCEVKFQPCYVGDIGDAINYIVETETLAKTYELAGPKRIYSVRINQIYVERNQKKKRYYSITIWYW